MCREAAADYQRQSPTFTSEWATTRELIAQWVQAACYLHPNNGDIDADHHLRVNGDHGLNSPLRVTSTLFRAAVGGNRTGTQLCDEQNVYGKAQGKACWLPWPTRSPENRLPTKRPLRSLGTSRVADFQRNSGQSRNRGGSKHGASQVSSSDCRQAVRKIRGKPLFNWLKWFDGKACKLPRANTWLEPYDYFTLVRNPHLQPTSAIEDARIATEIELGRRVFLRSISEWESRIANHEEAQSVLDRLTTDQRQQLVALVIDSMDELEN